MNNTYKRSNSGQKSIVKDSEGKYRKWVLTSSIVLCAVSLFLTYSAISRPLQVEEKVQDNLIKHNTAYSYQTTVKPCTLYPDGGTIQPDGIIFTQLTDAINIKAISAMTADRAFRIEGKRKLNITISANQYWQREFPLVEEEEFAAEGKEVFVFDHDIALEPDGFINFINRVEEETRFSVAEYSFIIKPVVEGVIVQNGYKTPIEPLPELVFRYSSNRLELGNESMELQTVIPIERTQRVTQYFNLAGYAIPLVTARYIFSILSALLLIISLHVLWDTLRFKKIMRDEAGAIDNKYANRLVTIKEDIGGIKDKKPIKVDSIKSLMRIADEKECPVLRYNDKEKGVTNYYITDGGFIYSFSASSRIASSSDYNIEKPITGSVAAHD